MFLLLGVSLLTFFVGLGHPTIADSDEAFYAQAALEMMTTGDLITPYYNGVFRFEKPVLFYWLVASGYLVAGVTEFVARVPSVSALSTVSTGEALTVFSPRSTDQSCIFCIAPSPLSSVLTLR